MAGVFRIGVVGVINRSSSQPLAKAAVPILIQKCGISGKIIRTSENIVRPKPYPYKEKNYGFLNAVFDKTTPRFDDNSKVSDLRSIASPSSGFNTKNPFR